MSKVSPAPMILAIEDDAAIRTVYAELLREEGYRVVTWGTLPTDDLAAVEALAPDLILLDLLIGGQALGWTLLNAFHNAPTTASIPVLVVTAAGTLARDRADAIDSLGCGLLLKPFNLDDLLDAITHCLAPGCDRAVS